MIELERKRLLNVSDMRGNCLWISSFLLWLITGFLYYTMSTLWVHSLCIFTKGMRGWAYKNKEKGNKGKWKQREWGEWVYTGHTCRAKSVESGGSVVHNVLHAGIFLLYTNMKSVLPFHSLVTIQSTRVPCDIIFDNTMVYIYICYLHLYIVAPFPYWEFHIYFVYSQVWYP
jgi:hypothetical protein